MIITSYSENVLSATSGEWRIWSLSDGYIDMQADLLRDPQNNPVPQTAHGAPLRLSVNCFALTGPGLGSVLIDSGGGGWASTVGHLEQTMTEAGIAPDSISVLALTHTHQDHVMGLLTPDGRTLFQNLTAIMIPEAAVSSFLTLAQLDRFQPLLEPIRDGDLIAGRLRAVDLPGHAPGHTGYALDTGEDRFLFFGDVVHVPALQFGTPGFSWAYDDDQPTARATRLKVFREASEEETWIAGAHLGRPGIGRVVQKGEAYGYEPAAG